MSDGTSCYVITLPDLAAIGIAVLKYDLAIKRLFGYNNRSLTNEVITLPILVAVGTVVVGI